MARPKQPTLMAHILDITLNVVVIAIVVGLIRTFLIAPFQVEGDSMVDTLESRQYIIINKLAYHIGTPERGDVVVFRPPSDEDKYYVKRVVGVPGDTVVIEDGYVYIQTETSGRLVKIEENYLSEDNEGHTYNHPPAMQNTDYREYTVPDGGYFLLGDNRTGSHDSRSFAAVGAKTAFVPEENISGRVWFVALPIPKIHAIESANYGL